MKKLFSGLIALAIASLGFGQPTPAGGPPPATQAEVNAGTVANKYVSPLTLTGSSGGPTVGPTHGGTGITSYTLGDMLYASAANTLAKLAGNTSATMAVLTQTGTGAVSAAPVWTLTTGTGNIVRANSPTFVTPTLGVASSTSETITGTAGAGFIDLVAQSSDPAAPASSHIRIFDNASNKFAWIGASGFVRNFDGTLTASRTFTLPDANSSIPVFGQTITFAGPTAARTVTFPDANFTVARTDAANTFAGTQTFSGSIAGTTANLSTPNTQVYVAATYSTYNRALIIANTATATIGYNAFIEFGNPSNADALFGFVTNASLRGDFVWSTYTGSVYREQMRLTDQGVLSVFGATSIGGNFVGSGALNAVNVAAGVTPYTEWEVDSTSTSSPRGIMSAQFNTGTDGARLHFRKARGTRASPTTVVTGDNLGRLVGTGYDGTSYLEMASIYFATEGTVATNRVPTNIQFWTATNASPSVLTLAGTIDSGQNWSHTGNLTVGGKVIISTNAADAISVYGITSPSGLQINTTSNGSIGFSVGSGYVGINGISVAGTFGVRVGTDQNIHMRPGSAYGLTGVGLDMLNDANGSVVDFSIRATAYKFASNGAVSVLNTTDSVSVLTGSEIISGGLGVAKAAFIGTTLNVAGNSTLTGLVSIGIAPTAEIILRNGTSLTASSGFAIAYNSSGGLTTAANSDSLVGLRVNNNFNNGGGFTGVGSYSISVPSQTYVGANGWGLNIGNVTGATTNFAIQTGLGKVAFGDTTVATAINTGALAGVGFGFSGTSGGASFIGGSLTTGAPSGGTAGAWKGGIAVTGVTSTFVTTNYIQLDVGGTLYKLATVTSVP